MTLYKRNKILFIVFIALLFFSPRLCNAADTEESAEEILFITSYNSDTKYTYDNISTFIQTYTQLGGKYSTIVENMNVTDLSQAHKWKETLTEILDKHPAVRHGAASFISKMRNTKDSPYSLQWHPATASEFRMSLLICNNMNPRALT